MNLLHLAMKCMDIFMDLDDYKYGQNPGYPFLHTKIANDGCASPVIPSKITNLLESLVLPGFDPSHPTKKNNKKYKNPIGDHFSPSSTEVLRFSQRTSLSSRRKVSILRLSSFGSGPAVGFAATSCTRGLAAENDVLFMVCLGMKWDESDWEIQSFCSGIMRYVWDS